MSILILSELHLLITQSSSTLIKHLSYHESYQSDHKSFTLKFFSHIRPSTERTTIQYRSYNTIDVENFKNDILSSPLHTNPASNAAALADQLYYTSCATVYLAPGITKRSLFDRKSIRIKSSPNKLTFKAFKTHWHVSLQTLQNINISHQHSKNVTGFQANKESIKNSFCSHTKH